MVPIYEENLTVGTWDCDRSDRLNIAGACNFWQEAAGRHAEALGVGTDAFKERGFAWILSRLSAELLRRPRRGERVLVRTWPRGLERLYALRDYEIHGEDKQVLGRGRSVWLVVDTLTFRPKRPETLGLSLPLNKGLDAMSEGGGSLVKRENLQPSGSRSALYSDIDYNGHVNNARYIQWIQDALPANDLEAASSMRVDINYLSEVKPASSLDFFIGNLREEKGSSAWAVEGKLSESGVTAFRAELSLK